MSLVEAHNAVIAHLKRTNLFDKVATQEPLSPPGKGLYAAMWFDEIRPAPGLSSLAGAGMVYVITVRLYKSATSEPGDSIDINLVEAMEAVQGSLIADHRLGDSAYAVDVLGAYSGGMSAVMDYVDFGTNRWHRVVELTLPIVIDGVHRYG